MPTSMQRVTFFVTGACVWAKYDGSDGDVIADAVDVPHSEHLPFQV